MQAARNKRRYRTGQACLNRFQHSVIRQDSVRHCCAESVTIQSSAMPNAKLRVAVIGAGAFGGWTALYLLRSGAQVTLLDAWGPGNSRASSGGESRVIRGSYGAKKIYTYMAARALLLWKENQARWKRQVFYKAGVLWMAGADDSYERASLAALRDVGLKAEDLGHGELARRYPQINFEGVPWAIFEKEGGFLVANLACRSVVEEFQAEGGEYREVAAEVPHVETRLQELKLSDGSSLSVDRYVFACGPWMGR